MIHLLPHDKVEFVYYMYPVKSTFSIDAKSKYAYISSGVVKAKYKLDMLNEKLVMVCFDKVIAGEIIRLCRALANGKPLTLELLKELEIKGEQECLEDFSDVSF